MKLPDGRLFALMRTGAGHPYWSVSADDGQNWTAPPKLFIDRPSGNSFYTSSTQVNGKCALWYNDKKYYLLGKVIGDSWFEGIPPMA